MKLKLLFAATLAAITFTACTNDDGNSDKIAKGEAKSVNLRITQSDTRAEAAKVDGTTTVALSDGYLYFADASMVTKIMTISTTAASSADVVNTADLVAGTTINNVPNSSTQILIISNLPSTVTPGFTAGSEVADVKDLAVMIAGISDLAGDVEEVPLYGEGTVVLDQNDKYMASATVEVSAMASRIEVGKFSLTADSKITSYKIAGIFINNYYSQQAIGGMADNAYLVNNGDDKTEYGDNTTAYPSGLPLYDWFATPLASNNGEIAPAAGKVWAYNVFPAKNTAPADDNLPHIIIALQDIMINDNPVDGMRYLTLASYKAVSSSAVVAEFVKARVYTIDSVVFSEKDLSIKPEYNTIDVTVDVNVLPWTTEPIIWNN